MRALSIILLFVTVLSHAQETEIISLKSSDRILNGSIANKYPITMYLKVAQQSDNVGYIYSVNGWYKYDIIGTTIPLSGIWTGSQLHLFVSDDSKFMENILNFTYENQEGDQYLENIIYELETFSENLPEIKERFHLDVETNSITGNWISKNKKLEVSIKSSNNRILKEVNYLKLPNGEYFELSNLGIPSRANCEIEASANKGKNLILNYTYQANLNYMGRCGGAENSGKVGLVFNEAYQLTSFTNAEFINCYRELTIDDLIKVSETVTNYKIYDYSSSKAEVYTVDSKNATLEKAKK